MSLSSCWEAISPSLVANNGRIGVTCPSPPSWSSSAPILQAYPTDTILDPPLDETGFHRATDAFSE